jgi:hypothetical protein
MPMLPAGRRGATGRTGGRIPAAAGRCGPDRALCIAAPAGLGRALPDADVGCGSCWADPSAGVPTAFRGGAAAAVPAGAVCVASAMRPGKARGAAALLPPGPSLMVPPLSDTGTAPASVGCRFPLHPLRWRRMCQRCSRSAGCSEGAGPCEHKRLCIDSGCPHVIRCLQTRSRNMG